MINYEITIGELEEAWRNLMFNTKSNEMEATKFAREVEIKTYKICQKNEKEKVKRLRAIYENMFISGKLRNCMKTIGRDEFMEKIDEIFGDLE